jgi:hypothetical protein
MARLLLIDPKPLIQGFTCPVTQRDCIKYTGCEAENARYRGGHGPTGIQILGKFKCACGKNLICKILVDGVEMTPARYRESHQPTVEPK